MVEKQILLWSLLVASFLGAYSQISDFAPPAHPIDRVATLPSVQESGLLADSVFSILIRESDDLYIGKPSRLYISPTTGDLYIADSFSSRIVRFDREGEPTGIIGRKGEGPGEFINPRPLIMVDTVLFVADNQQLRLQRFDAEDGSFISNHLYEGILYSAAAGEDRVWLGLNDRGSHSGVTAFQPSGALFGELVPWPPEYEESVRLAAIFDAIYLDAWGDTVATGYQGSSDIQVLVDGRIVDVITVPTARRKGATEEAVAELQNVPFPEAFAMVSALFGLHRTPSGEIVLVHFDQEWLEEYVTAEVYVSVLSQGREQVCLDHHLLSSEDGQPQIAFRGDSLFVLSQQVREARAETWVTAYRIDTSSCNWADIR